VRRARKEWFCWSIVKNLARHEFKSDFEWPLKYYVGRTSWLLKYQNFLQRYSSCSSVLLKLFLDLYVVVWIFTILQQNRSLCVEKYSFTPMCSIRKITVWFYFVRFRFTSPLTSWSNIVKWRVRSLNIPKRRSSVSLIGSESQFGPTSPSKWRAISMRLVHTMTCNPLFRADQQIASREERFCWKI